ncbi:class II aldolase/adducin family protein [marine bacterium AO1-C]|nr:class II aldolase/adducin family protein [marine bacterium AO1-C]
MAVLNPPGIEKMISYPKFDSIEQKRHYLKRTLAGAFRLFGKFGFAEGVAGHITCRDPEHTDCFWVNPFGVSFRRIKMSDLILVNEQGEIVAGKHQALNKAAFAIHSAIHKARPDVIAAAHSHSVYGKTWSAVGRLLDPLTQDSCIFYEDHGLFDDYTGVVGELSEGERIGKALSDKKAVILQNHGLLTVGHSIEECIFWFVTMERTCQSQLLAEATGNELIKIGHEVASRTRDYEVGFPLAGYFSFQPMWQDIVHEQPDFMDIEAPEAALVL